MRTIEFDIEFSPRPAGRYPDDGEFNATRFREELLRPALDEHGKVVIYIDRVESFSSAFLEEAFGGLVSKGYFTAKELRERLIIKFNDEVALYVYLIWKYINNAKIKE